MWIKIAATLWAALAVTVLFARAAQAADEVHEGKVLAVSTNSITVNDDKDGDIDKFEVASDTKITLNGKPAKLSEIHAGDRAKVTATQKGDKLVAKEIAARSPE